MKVKICGIKNSEELDVCAKNGADFVGFNFYKKSPRYIDKETAKKLLQQLPKTVKSVGVFVDEPIDSVNTMADELNLDYVQLHGSESTDYIKQLNRPVIKAFRIKNKDSIKEIQEYNSFVDYFLLDAYDKNNAGGSGKQFKYEFIAALPASVLEKKVFIAGGLTPENVSDVLGEILTFTAAAPFGTDVASGVENRAGEKDLDKIVKFIKNAKEEKK